MVSKSSRILQLSFAALMLASAALSVAPQVHAASVSSPDLAGGFIFNEDPNRAAWMRPATNATSTLVDGQRTVRLFLTGTSANIKTIIMDADYVGNSYIAWNPGTASRATGFPTVNAPAPYTTGTLSHPHPYTELVYDGGNVPGQAPMDFVVSFSVKGSPAPGTVFNVNVTAIEVNGQATHRFQKLPALQIRIEDTKPVIRNVWATDLNSDGHIDFLYIEFTDHMDLGTFHLDQFNFTRTMPNGNVRVYQPLPGQVSWDTPRMNLSIGISALAYYDTGDMPDVKYTSPDIISSFTDLAGNPMDNVVWGHDKVIDRARPVMVSALGFVGSSQMILTFSEPVAGSGGKSRPGCTGSAAAPTQQIQLCDLQYNNGCAVPPCSGDNVGSNTDLQPTTDLAFKTSITIPLIYINNNPVKFGTQDVSFVAGDTINAVSVSGGNCPSKGHIPINALFPDEGQLPGGCTAIYDRANNTIALTGDYAIVKVSSPQVLEAEVNIDSFTLTLQFNGPVSAVTGDNFGIEMRSIDVDTTNNGSPGGIDRIKHDPGTPLATVILDNRVTPSDVDSTPSYIVINCDPAKPAPASFIKATGLGQDITVPCQRVPMVDRTQPAILHAGTIDRDHDGFIDGFKLEFNEPVNDATFCSDEFGVSHNPCPSVFTVCNNWNVTAGQDICTRRQDLMPCSVYWNDKGVIANRSQLPANEQWHPGMRTTDVCNEIALMVTGLNPGTPITFLTGDKANDRFGFFVWPEEFNLTGAASGTNPRFNPIYTDFVPDILTFQYPVKRGDTDTLKRIGLFRDMVSNGTTSNVMANVTDEKAPPPLQSQVVTETDTAPPVLLRAETYDAKVPDAYAEGNGYLDGYRLTFSEAVRDSTFTSTEWNVGAAHHVTGYTTGVPTASVPLNLLTNDNVLIVDFDENQAMVPVAGLPDTDQKPDLAYSVGVGPTNPTGLKDLYGNAMLPFTLRDVSLLDRARPVIVSVTGFPGQDWITVNFSEPVDNGADGPLTWDDFFYTNACHSNDNSDASGRDSGPGAQPVEHTPGSKTVRLHLNRPLTNLDLGQGCQGGLVDTINSVYNTTWETAPSLLPGERQSVSTVRHAITMGDDIVAPGDPLLFAVDANTATATSVSLHWTAPGDDSVPRGVPVNLDTAHGKVAGYSVKVSALPNGFNQTEFPGIQNPAGLTYTFVADRQGTLGFAEPGQIQTLMVSGLEPTTTYHFAVEACDEVLIPKTQFPPIPDPADQCFGHRNLSNATDATTDQSAATTLQDLTPPVGDLTISSTTHRKNQPSINTVAAFNWTTLSDPESTVTYYYELTRDPNAPVGPQAGPGGSIVVFGNATRTAGGVTVTHIPDGSWTFSVVGFSGGGPSKIARYTIVVGYAPIRADDIRAANGAIIVTSERLRGTNMVNWTLPPKESLPGNAVLQGIQIWRMDDGKVGDKPIYAPTGTYEALQNGTYRDTNGTATSAYRVDMVFQKDQTMADASQGQKPQDFVENFKATFNKDRSGGLPTWLAITLAVLAVLIIVGVVLLVFVMRKRSQRLAAGTGGPGYVYQAAPPAATDAATGMPIHDVRCPNCSTEFQAQGQMPLQIACPNCGVAGVLQ